MPYAQNQDLKIHYEETGQGTPLVLQHGLASSIKTWTIRGSNYIDALRDKYRLIMVDARGHGESGRPHEPGKYAMKHMVTDIIFVLDELEIKKALYWGYSMGGRIGLAAAKYTPERFTAYVIGGCGLSEKDSEGEINELRSYVKLFERGIDAWVSTLVNQRGSALESWEYEHWRNSDLEAYIAYLSYYENIGMADYLPKLSAPFLLYAGEDDRHVHSAAKACAGIIQDALFVSLPGLNHMGAQIGSPAVLPHVLRFLDEITKQ
jgi:pimeloyl-ACP methyl ester carboxylesterase